MIYTTIDIETTGLDPLRHGIISVGTVTTDDSGEVLTEYYSLANPMLGYRCEIDRLALDINGITPDQIMAAPPLLVVLRDMMFSWLEQPPILVFHNAPTDVAFLMEAIRRRPIARDYHTPFRRVLDTVSLNWQITGKLQSLNEMCAYWGVARGQQHNALEDARATSKVFHKLMSQIDHTRTLDAAVQRT